MIRRTAEIIAFILNVVLYSFVLKVGVPVWKYTGGLILAVPASVISFIVLKLAVAISSQ